jgi:hypothetical protein
MPPRPIEHEHELFVGTGSHLACEFREFNFEEGNAHASGQMKHRAARRRMDEADEITPGKAMTHRSAGAPTYWRPDAAQQWLQADAMLVGRPEFDLRPRKRCCHGL